MNKNNDLLKGELIKEDKLVSFIIPIYETEQYLKKCIDCLLEQDYTNIELIFVMDGYSRKADRILRLYKDKRIKMIDSIQHSGAPKARNTGYKHAQGDYIVFWDSDCYAEPGMVRMWIKYFNTFNTDFVYSGYRFLDDNHTFSSSEPFNPYLMTCNNYICTMSPMRKDIFPGFDESLKSLQDWDLFLTLIEKGYKGHYIKGSGFSTEMRKKSISSQGCTHNVWLERYNTVRNKHNIKDRDICFCSIKHRFRAQEMAETFKQDYSDMPSYHPHQYKMVYGIGFYPSSMEKTSSFFKSADGRKDYVNILHWTGQDIESMFNVPYNALKFIVSIVNKAIKFNFCENEISRKMLAEIGIKSEVLMLPISDKISDIKLPKEFKVYYENDEATKDLVNDIIKSCPDIKFETPESCMLKDYSCLLALTGSPMPSENVKRFIASGRYVITNYECLYMNNIELKKEAIIKKIREIKKICRNGIMNTKPQQYYLKATNTDNFITRIKECLK